MITFVDSQDPRSRSAIQRHTAFHSNAQRRDARLQSLRSTSRPRVLEWQRRPQDGVMAATSTSASSSSSASPMPATRRALPVDFFTGSSSSTAAEAVTVPGESQASNFSLIRPRRANRVAEAESLRDYFDQHVCPHARHRAMQLQVVEYISADDACRCLFSAYVLAQQRHDGNAADEEQNRARTGLLMARGSALLRDKLETEPTVSSDGSIQAVLLMIAYTADFGNPDDVQIHANALRTMLAQRGGVESGLFPSLLAEQCAMVHRSRRFHLTFDCGESCDVPLRFASGLFEQ